MNSIERFYATIERRPVDRPACWLGAPTPTALPALCRFFGAADSNELKKICGDDFYALEIPYHSLTCSAIYAAFDWYRDGSNVDAQHRTLTAEGCFARCETPEDIEAVNFAWPDPALSIDPVKCRRLIEEAPKDKVILGLLWASHFQDVCAAFGMENCLMNMLTEPEIVHYVNDRIVDFYLKAMKIFLDAAEGKVHALLIGNDLGSQRGLILSPDLIRRFVIPGAKKLIELAHSYGVKVIYHSCGAVADIIPLLAEAGADAVHPMQALAQGMDPACLKEQFGNVMSFCGGLDTQQLLPNGTPEMVADSVRRLRELFPTGLIISPSHEGLQEDIPPENVKAMLEEATRI